MAAAITSATVGWDRDTWLREVAVGTIAGGLAGALVGGIGGRLAMRISGAMTDIGLGGIPRTANGNRLGEITLEGTLALVLFAGLFPGVIAGLVYVAARPWLRPLGRWAGPAFGLAVLLAIGSAVLEPFNFDFRKFGSPAVNVALFAALFPLFGVALQWSTALVERRIGDGVGWTMVLWATAAIAALFLTPVVIGAVQGLSGVPFDAKPLVPPYLITAAVAMRILAVRSRAAYAVLLAPAVIGAPATLEAMLILAR